MTGQAVLVKIPDDVYERMREDAERGNTSVEGVLSDMATLFFAPLPELDSVLETMETYSDDQLWRVVQVRLTQVQEQRLEQLTQRAKAVALTEEEKEKLDALADLIEHQMLLRSQALLLLKQRGYERAVETYLNSGKIKIVS